MVDVEATLRDLGDRLDVPPVGDLAEGVATRIERLETQAHAPRRRWTVPVVAAAAVLVVLATVVAVLPEPRQAVARWFGIGGVRFELTGDGPLDPDVSSELDLGAPVAAEEAAGAVPFELGLPGAIGPPAAAYVGRPPDGISMVWPPAPELPEVGDTGVGLLLTEFPGSTTETLVRKELGTGTRLEQVTVDGRDGYWITGAPHVVTYLDPAGDPHFDRVRLAGNTLLWEVDGVTHRLESALDLEAMFDLAESLRPIR
jgi:hypothetical protein